MTSTRAQSPLPDPEQAPPGTNGADGGPLPHRKVLWVFAGVMVTMLLGALDQTIVSTALPTIVGELNGLEQLSWVVTAYMLAATVGMPIYGKAGDIFGRKVVFQFAILTFLLGSVLCGMAQDMTQLILFRALQGVGGGGLMISAQAIIADVVSARDRGRYMGLLGGVFGVASIAGPLLGGVFTDHLSWRWIFYINLPLGALALLITTVTLQLPKPSGPRPKLDYLGTLLLAAASVCLVLVTSWGGTEYDWSSPVIIGLGAGAVAAAALFVAAERFAAEPVIPLQLFRDRDFVLVSLVGITVGIAMFSTVSYLPTFLQMVNGATATESGLRMIPMVVGMLTATITTGRLISRTGRYKIWPIAGTTVIMAGLFLLSRMDADTTYLYNASAMLVLGLGVGMVMQNLVLIVQNSAPRRHLGTATSATNYFRQIGASFGIAVFGSLFVNRLNGEVGELPAGAGAQLQAGGGEAGLSSLTPDMLEQMPAQVQQFIVHAFADALPPIFVYGVPIVLVGFVLAFFIRERPLSTTVGESTGEGEPAETDAGPAAAAATAAGRPGQTPGRTE